MLKEERYNGKRIGRGFSEAQMAWGMGGVSENLGTTDQLNKASSSQNSIGSLESLFLTCLTVTIGKDLSTKVKCDLSKY